MLEGLGEGCGKRSDASLAKLAVRQRVRIHVERPAGIAPAGDAIEPRGEEGAQRKVGVAGRIARSELHVDGLPRGRRPHSRYAHRGFAVLEAPCATRPGVRAEGRSAERNPRLARSGRSGPTGGEECHRQTARRAATGAPARAERGRDWLGPRGSRGCCERGYRFPCCPPGASGANDARSPRFAATARVVSRTAS